MPRFTVKQPNGLYSIFSTVVDHFVAYDATREQIKQYWREEAITEADRESERSLNAADALGDKRFTDCLATVDTIHGHAEAEHYRKRLTDSQSLAQVGRLPDAASETKINKEK